MGVKGRDPSGLEVETVYDRSIRKYKEGVGYVRVGRFINTEITRWVYRPNEPVGYYRSAPCYTYKTAKLSPLGDFTFTFIN